MEKSQNNHLSYSTISKKRYRMIIFLLVTFLVCFPKGGIKVSGIPITWGYLFLGLIVMLSLLGLLYKRVDYINKQRLLTMMTIIPFQVLITSSLFLNGQDNLGMTISLLVNFIFLPWTFIVLFGYYIDVINYEILFKYLKRAVFFVSVYGIFLFLFKFVTGDFFQIPYLTVNIDDVGHLGEKHINRGGIFKLISTYNNGNLYGACMLIILPLYEWLENRKFNRFIVKLSLVLTLSRTVWIGLVIYELLSALYIRKPNFKTIFKKAISFIFILSFILYSLNLMGRKLTFLADENLGGRSDQFNFLDTATFFPSEPFNGIAEITYLYIIKYFGYLGLGLFLLCMSFPIILQFFRKTVHSNTSYKRSLTLGLILYLIISTSDGAIQLIPVMVFYWFISSLLISHNITFKQLNPSTK